MEVEVETRQNTRDISALTNTVTRLATIVEQSEKRNDEDRGTMREIFSNLKGLNDKVGVFTTVSEKVSALSEQQGALRHDIKNIQQGMQALPLLKNREGELDKFVAGHEIRLKTIETWKDKHDGAAGAIKIVIHLLWAVFGSGITAMGFYFMSDYFNHVAPSHTLTTLERKETISGE